MRPTAGDQRIWIKHMDKDVPYSTEGIGEYVIELFPKDFKGVCIDVGAYHPIWQSNTYVFGLSGWTIFYVEPNPNCAHHFSKDLHQYAIGPENKDEVDYFIYSDSEESSFTGLFHYPTPYQLVRIIKVKQRTLNWFMDNVVKVPRLDYLSIDAEGFDLLVLQSIDLGKWDVNVITIENWNNYYYKNFPDKRTGTEAGEYLRSRGYQLVQHVYFNETYQKVD